jgi:membrane-bound lytic murein transglycosylase B
MKVLYLFAFGVLGACSTVPPPAPLDEQAATLPASPPAGGAPMPAYAPPAPPLITPPAPPLITPPTAPVAGSLAKQPQVQAFIQEMVARHHFNSNQLYAVFSHARVQTSIIDAMNRPAEAKPWYAYREIFLTPRRIQGGVQFWRTYQPALARAERIYGVPAEIIVAIIGMETSYGGNMGKYRVLEALSTLAFAYPRRADYFRKELENYLLLTRAEGIDPVAVKGSYAGAMGLGQFMPGSYLRYAVDFDGDGHRDLWNNPVDAIGSVANYLSKNRWQAGAPITVRAFVEGGQYRELISRKAQPPAHSVLSFRQQGVIPESTVNDSQKAILLELQGSNSSEYWLGFDNFYVITRYNQSPLYAMAVYQLSQTIRENAG